VSERRPDDDKGSGVGEARRMAFSELWRLIKIMPKPAWATPALVILGLLSSLAETLGITLLFLLCDGAARYGGVNRRTIW
jgi:hypothetical protein